MLSVLRFAAFTWCFTCFQCMLRGDDVGCSPCRISRRLHGVSHVFSAYRRVQNPCKTMAATSVLRGNEIILDYTHAISHGVPWGTALAGTSWGRGGAAFHAESNLQAKWRGLGLCAVAFPVHCLCCFPSFLWNPYALFVLFVPFGVIYFRSKFRSFVT